MDLLRKGLLYTAVLVGVYLAVANATGGGKIIGAASNAYIGGVKVLQGR